MEKMDGIDVFSKSPPIILQILKALYWFDEGIRKYFEDRGVKPNPRSQTMLIANVAMGVRKPNQVAANLGISRQAVSKLVAELVSQGAITSIEDPDDKRGVLLSLNPESDRNVHLVVEAMEHLETRLSAIIGHDRLQVLRAALNIDWGEP
jgi:DNA-binding MarR family transcriptional regulator